MLKNDIFTAGLFLLFDTFDVVVVVGGGGGVKTGYVVL